MVASVALVAACGSTGHSPAQPAPGVTSFAGGAFDQVPRYPRSEPLGARNDTGDLSQQTFKATGTTPEQVIDWYGAHLDGWKVLEAPHKTGATDFAGRWEKGGRTLRVTTGPAPTVGSETTVQYSLLLQPRG